MDFYHSVTLIEERCMGCTNCIKRCPTEAIRVRDGKARIIKERCIDCGECIRICPHHAKKARFSALDSLDKYKYRIALPAPSLYGQFQNLDDVDYVLNGLIKMGFDYVLEVSVAAELVSEYTRNMMNSGKVKKPVISSACPATVRLIRVKFPDLCSHVLPLQSPMEIAARMAKRKVHKDTGIDMKDIGCFFITPCPAKVTDIRAPISTEKSCVDEAIAISDIYPILSGKMSKLNTLEPIAHTGIIGVSWASSGGESAALIKEKYLAADGIENVIRVLEDIEDEKIKDLDFIELNACTGGCVGGVLCVENPYIAQAKIQKLRKYLPVSQNHTDEISDVDELMKWDGGLQFSDVLTLSKDIREAMKIMMQIDEIEEKLPGLDCGACGSPNCKSFAEDVVKGDCKISECVFILKEKMQKALDALNFE